MLRDNNATICFFCQWWLCCSHNLPGRKKQTNHWSQGNGQEVSFCFSVPLYKGKKKPTTAAWVQHSCCLRTMHPFFLFHEYAIYCKGLCVSLLLCDIPLPRLSPLNSCLATRQWERKRGGEREREKEGDVGVALSQCVFTCEWLRYSNPCVRDASLQDPGLQWITASPMKDIFLYLFGWYTYTEM